MARTDSPTAEAVLTSVKNHTPPRQTVGVLLAMHSLVSGSFAASIGCNSQVECGAGQASGWILPRISVYAHLPRGTGKLYQRIKIAPNVSRRWQTRQVNRWNYNCQFNVVKPDPAVRVLGWMSHLGERDELHREHIEVDGPVGVYLKYILLYRRRSSML